MRKKYIYPIVLFILFFAFYSLVYKHIPIRYWDEQAHIGKSYYFDLLVNGDKYNLWNTYYGYNVPPLPQYIYGAVLYGDYLNYKNTHQDKQFIYFLIDHNFYEINTEPFVTYREEHESFIDWGDKPDLVFDVTPQELVTMFGSGIQPTIDIIFKARSLHVFFLTLTILLTYFLTKELLNPCISFIVSFFYGINYLLVIFGLRVQSDGLFILLFTLLLYLIIIFTKFVNRKIYSQYKLFLLVSSMGVCTALLMLTKINGAMILVFIDILLSYYLVKAIKSYQFVSVRNFCMLIILFNMIFLVVFIGLFPYLHESPIQNTIIMFEEKAKQAQRQSVEFPEYYLSSFPERIRAIFYNFLFHPTEHCHFNGTFFQQNACRLDRTVAAKLVLSALGIVYLITYTKVHKRKKILYVVGSFYLFIFIMMGIYLVLDWDRYYIQLVYLFTLIKILGIFWVITKLQLLLKKYVPEIILRSIED